MLRKAQEDDIYNLKDWELVSSSPAALWSQLDKAIKEEKWIV
jgi:ABC-type proline/glycine betaine transport system substrate-binding protein